MVVTDTASYSDIVFGLFAICGYQFSRASPTWPTRGCGRIDTTARYGALDELARHAIRPCRIRQHWEDMLRVAGSLTTGEVRAHDLIRMLARDGRPTGLGDAFAHYGRIFKTLHVLQFVHDESYRRLIGSQLNVQEARHRLARRIFFGQRGELRQAYREGMEDQLSALGLALKQLAAAGLAVSDELLARLSPLQFEHINFHGRYTFAHPQLNGALRPLRDPHATDDEADLAARSSTAPGEARCQRSSASSAARRSSSSERA